MLLFQMIFRKVSDVKKERELAERRKDDPALNQTQDHLVRKIFSKFKKSGTVDPPPPNVIVRDVERGETSGAATSASANNPSGGDNNNKVTSPFMNSTAKAINGKNKVAAAVTSQQGPIKVTDGSGSSSAGASQPAAAPKRLSGWARLKGGSEDGPTPQQQQEQQQKEQQQMQQQLQQHTNERTESMQCNLDLLPSAKSHAESNKNRHPEYDSSIAEMIENSKKTQVEVQKLTERVAKMEEVITEFVQKLNSALPLAAASSSAATVDDERHYTKRSKSKSRHHHRSSSTSGPQPPANPAQNSPGGGGGAAAGASGPSASSPGTPSNSGGNAAKISSSLKLSTKNEEFL